MKKKINWNTVPWTPFQRAVYDPADPSPKDRYGDREPERLFNNSRYQVAGWGEHHPLYGRVVHLSIKTHDRQARHDWRDLQRIKNELVGPEYDAVEIYPAESRLVDTANQFHIFVFIDYKLELGFSHRLVAEGAWEKARQRPFDAEIRPVDVMSVEEMSAYVKAVADESGDKQRRFLEAEYARLAALVVDIGSKLGKSVVVQARDAHGIDEIAAAPDLSACSECERSHGPHFRGRCVH